MEISQYKNWTVGCLYWPTRPDQTTFPRILFSWVCGQGRSQRPCVRFGGGSEAATAGSANDSFPWFLPHLLDSWARCVLSSMTKGPASIAHLLIVGRGSQNWWGFLPISVGSSLSSLPPTLHQSYLTQPQLPVPKIPAPGTEMRATASTSSLPKCTGHSCNESIYVYIRPRVLLLGLNSYWNTVTNSLKMKVLPATWCYLDTPDCITFQQVFLTLHIWGDHFKKGKAHSPDNSDPSSTVSMFSYLH